MADEAKNTGGIATQSGAGGPDTADKCPGSGEPATAEPVMVRLATARPAQHGDPVVPAFERRIAPARDLVEHAAELTDAAHAMAMRFNQGGKLIVFGIGGASTDAQHARSNSSIR